MAVLPQGCATWVPPVYRRACPVGVDPPPPFPLRPPSPPSVDAAAAIATSVSATALGEGAPWARAAAELAEWACGGATEADRAAAQDALGAEHLQPLQFSDDLTVPCPSPGALRAVVSAEPDSACSRFARAVRADFNCASGKTAAMAVAGSPDPGWVGCPVVDQKLVLGVLVDADLTFQPLLRSVLARGHALFEALFHAGESGGFGLPVLSAQVPLRVESAILYPSPFLLLAHRAEYELNRMQAAWARRLLACTTGPPVPGEVVVAQCGWTCRLGTRMLERAIMARARLLAQPPDHPGTRMLALARRLTCASWASAVAARMAELTPPVLDIDVHPVFCHPLRGAQCSLQLRRSLLRDFKLQVVRPALRARDRTAFQRATGACLPTLGMSFAVLVPEPNQLPMALFQLDFWATYVARLSHVVRCAYVRGMAPPSPRRAVSPRRSGPLRCLRSCAGGHCPCYLRLP